jgi:hypothetical protein
VGGKWAGSGTVLVSFHASLGTGLSIPPYPVPELLASIASGFSSLQAHPPDASCPAPQGNSTGSMSSSTSPARRNVKAAPCLLCLSTSPYCSGTAGRTSLSCSSGEDLLVWREGKSCFCLRRPGEPW